MFSQPQDSKESNEVIINLNNEAAVSIYQRNKKCFKNSSQGKGAIDNIDNTDQV